MCSSDLVFYVGNLGSHNTSGLNGDGVFTKASSLLYAAVAELADALDSGSSESNFIRVQVPSAAPGKTPVTMSFGMVTGVFMFYFRACFCALLPFAPLVISERCFRAFSNVITTASFFWRLRHMRIALISADLIIHLSRDRKSVV